VGTEAARDPSAPGPAYDALRERAPGVVGGLRRHTARGTIVNTVFVVGVAVLSFVQRLVVAALLTPTQFGVWSAVLITVLTIVFVKNAGIGERFVQQDEPNQELAFRKAFTIDLLLSVGCMAAVAVLLPLFALLYGHWEVVAPGVVLSTLLVGNALQAPVWIFYRRMDFRRQRLLQAIDPAVVFVVTITLAALGASYWSLVVGAVAGAYAGGIAALVASPFRPGIAIDRATVSDYFRFSWPVVVANGSGVAIGQTLQVVAVRMTGLRGGGAIGLGSSATAFSDGVDGIVTQTLYPAICAVSDRPALLFESFVKTNRLGLIWGAPFGIGVALFAPDLVRHVLGDKWAYAVPVLVAFGVVSAVDQLGFNWHAFLRATNHTRPLAQLGFLSLGIFLLVTVPLLVAFGLTGFAWGWVAWGVLTVTGRAYFLRPLFPRFSMLRQARRAALPLVPGVAAVLLARLLVPGRESPALAVAELAAYVLLTAAATFALERRLLAEMLGYLRHPPSRAVPTG
jgi:O-antigen/teichoic acid export membrane protein